MKTPLSGMRPRITEEWRREFPGLGRYKPMWLARRLGPVVQGISLSPNGANDEYKPIPHVHCLAHPSQSVTLTSDGNPRDPYSGCTVSVRARFHEGKVPAAADAVRLASLLPLDRVPEPDEIVAAYRRLLGSGSSYAGPLARRQENLASVLAWFGRADEAEAALREAARHPEAWERHFEPEDGAEAWLERQLRRVGDLDGLRATVVEEVLRHKLRGVPTHYDP